MGADGSLLVLSFALCGGGALAGIVVPERRNPALLAWAGSLAALAALWVSADVLRSGRVFKGDCQFLAAPRASRRTGERVGDPVRRDSQSRALRHRSVET
jgi:hypothetical protein